jgi:phage terminase small subunit
MGKEAVERLKKHGFIVIEEKEGVCRYVVIQMAFFQGRRF